jgi:hypothetical protein
MVIIINFFVVRCSDTRALRPITETAQENKTKTYDNNLQKGNTEKEIRTNYVRQQTAGIILINIF